ncbi:hypothetical protein WAI453_011702 [Rhynchosporium graminicola]
MTQDATPPTDRDPPSIYAIKDRAAVPKFADRDSGTTKPYDSGLRYREVWGSADLSNLTEEQRIARNQHADKLNEAYYDFITDHYQGGWGNKFHFCGYYPGESWDQAQARHEHHLALSMGMAADMKVLDIGCGVGGPAREMAKFTGCRVTGVTINDLHVERSNELNRECGMQDQVNMVKGNFVDLPFKDGEFDQAYATEALCCAPDMLKAYQEAFRVLKPGGVLGMLDWVLTDKYDDGNEMHRNIRNEVERGGSVPLLTSVKAHVQALEEAGFEIVVENDRATDKSNPIGWWTTLDGQNIQHGLVPLEDLGRTASLPSGQDGSAGNRFNSIERPKESLCVPSPRISFSPLLNPSSTTIKRINSTNSVLPEYKRRFTVILEKRSDSGNQNVPTPTPLPITHPTRTLLLVRKGKREG